MNKEQIRDLIIFHLLDCNVPETANYASLDCTGELYFYQKKPFRPSAINDAVWTYEINDALSMRDAVLVISYEKYGFDWKDSLVKL